MVAGTAQTAGVWRGDRACAALVAGALIVIATLASGAARATTVDAINRARNAACAGPGGLHSLEETGALDGVAHALAHGATLHDALGRLPLRPEYATSVRLIGVNGERDIAQALSARYCGELARPELRQVGVAWAGASLYIVVTVPFDGPTPGDRVRVAREILSRVNAARAMSRRCGATYYPAAAPLTLSELLSRAAASHSAAMGARDDLAHRDPDGSMPADRVRRAGYSANLVGENVASGVPTAAEVVAGWLASPGHCANIMDQRFTEMGVAYFVAPHSDGAIYWTQLFAQRRT